MTCYNFALLCKDNEPEKAEALRKEALSISEKYKETNTTCQSIIKVLTAPETTQTPEPPKGKTKKGFWRKLFGKKAQ